MLLLLRLSFFVLLFLWSTTGPAQTLQPINAVRYTVSEGLSNNQVKSLAQDGNGFMWMSTHSSVQWFDGIRFHNIEKGNGIHQLPKLDLVKMNTLKTGDLICTYAGGFSVYNFNTHSFAHYNISGSNDPVFFIRENDEKLLLLQWPRVIEYHIAQKKRFLF